MQYFLDFGYIITVQTAGLVHTLDNLIGIVAYALELRGVVLNVGMGHIDDVSINRYLAHVGAHRMIPNRDSIGKIHVVSFYSMNI